MISRVPAVACIEPECVLSAAAAATVASQQGLAPFRVESTNDTHLSISRSPAYVTTTFATWGSLFVAAITFVLLMVRTGKLELEGP